MRFNAEIHVLGDEIQVMVEDYCKHGKADLNMSSSIFLFPLVEADYIHNHFFPLVRNDNM